MSEINFIFDFVKKLDKDSKYYIGKPYTFDPKKLEILELYKEFIKKNESFVNTDTVDKIVLVGKLETMSKEEILEIEKKIHDVIHTGKLEELLEFCDKI